MVSTAGEPTPARGQLWHGRFEGGPADALQRLNDSLPFDQRMYREDIAGSRAHVTMLEHVGLLSTIERDAILGALDQVESEFDAGTMAFMASDEDIHTAVERRVTELEPAGAKIHTGRSRNDQVATDVRLWTLGAIDEVIDLLLAFQATLLAEAKAAGDAYLPGYTHLQQAQPVSLAHHLLAHAWMLARDVDRLLDARRRTNVSVLGAGALAGSSLPLDPPFTAALLNMPAVFDNSLDAVADRDFVADTLYSLAMIGVHLSRIGEELILWSSSEFGFVELDDAFSTGSSMMPQKKNPDIAELARGKGGRLIGNLTGFLASVKGLPLTYNKDMQEDKEPLFDAVDTVRLTLLALDGMVSTLTFELIEWPPQRRLRMQRQPIWPNGWWRMVWRFEMPTPWSVSLFAEPSQERPRCPTSWPPIRVWAPMPQRCSSLGFRSPAEIPMALAVPMLWRRSSTDLPHSFGQIPSGLAKRAPDRASCQSTSPCTRAAWARRCWALWSTVRMGLGGSSRSRPMAAPKMLRSHACRGVTPRTEPMFGPPGVLYVYFIYGMYHCANVVTGPAGDGQAVLIRAIEPNEVTEAMRTARPTIRRDEDLTNGPGKLCAALGIDRSHDGLNLLHTDSSVRLVIDEPVAPAEIETSTRIGISVAQERPWRWYLRDNAWVSKPR